MIRFHGRPFLEYLLEMLQEQGFRKVLLLLGYLSDQVREYFGDGRGTGLEIEYSTSAVENETGLRLTTAAAQVEPISLLLYCDNYWPMPFAAMWQQFRDSGALAQVTVYRNR